MTVRKKWNFSSADLKTSEPRCDRSVLIVLKQRCKKKLESISVVVLDMEQRYDDDAFFLIF